MLWRDLFLKPPKHIKYGLALASMVWGWLGFKQIESVVYPVVSDFRIERVEQSKDRTLIAGRLSKHRDCQFKEVIALNGASNVVSVEFQETAYNTTGVVSRPVGSYEWGWWALVPRASYLKLFSRHECMTGEVLTELWEGDL